VRRPGDRSRILPVLTAPVRPTEDGCELSLIHETSHEWADQTVDGWTMILDGLAEVLL
jgi:hypothetical protein